VAKATVRLATPRALNTIEHNYKKSICEFYDSLTSTGKILDIVLILVLLVIDTIVVGLYNVYL